MKNLFLIDGASGTGKSDLLNWVRGNNPDNVTFVRKGSTRAPRHYEGDDREFRPDLEFLTSDDFARHNFDYKYWYGSEQYGFYKSDLNEALIAADNVFVIVRNTALINRIATEYDVINVVPMLIYTDRAELEKRLRDERLDEDEIQSRVERSERALEDYYSHPESYREVVINNSSPGQFHRTIDRLVDKYDKQPSIDPYMIAVMMSFNPSNKRLDDYFDAMQAAVKSISRKFECKRINKAPGSPKIAEEFRGLTASARCIIVDLTENKQNVYYELGYAQARGKTVLITADNDTDPSFYPREYKIIFYDSALDLRAKVAQELRALLVRIPGV